MLDALLEGLVEGAEIPLGLGDGLARERDQDAAEGLGQLPGGGPDERVPFLLGRQVSQDGPDLLGGGRDGAYRIQLLTKRQLR